MTRTKMKDLKFLTKFSEKGSKFLDVKYPVLCGAMSWISESNLVAAVSNSGGFGIIAAANMPAKALADQIDKTFEKTKSAFGVNIITVTPFFDEQIDVVIEKKNKAYIFRRGDTKRKKY